MLACAFDTARWLLGETASSTSNTINASGIEIAQAFVCQKAGTLSDAWINFSAVTSPPVLEYRVETCNSSGNPSGTLVAANANGTLTPTVSAAWRPLTSGPTVAKGDIVFLRVKYSSGTIGGSNFATVLLTNTANNSPLLQPGIKTTTNNGSAWSNFASRIGMMALRYSDGTVVDGGLAIVSLNQWGNFNSTTNPDEMGIVWTESVGRAVCGAVFGPSLGASVSGNVYLYDAAGSVLASAAITGARAFAGVPFVAFTAAVQLTRGDTYRLTLRLSTSNSVNFVDAAFDSAAAVEAYAGEPIGLTRRQGGSGSFTDDMTSWLWISPLVESINAASGSNIIVIED